MNLLTACPLCTGDLIQQTRKVSFSYKGQTIELDQTGQYCSRCEEGFLTPEESRQNDRSLRAFHNQVDGLLTPDQIKTIRKRLHLSQADAGHIFGGGPMAFSKYERGEITHSRALDIVLRLLDSKQVSLETIKLVEQEALAV